MAALTLSLEPVVRLAGCAAQRAWRESSFPSPTSSSRLGLFIRERQEPVVPARYDPCVLQVLQSPRWGLPTVATGLCWLGRYLALVSLPSVAIDATSWKERDDAMSRPKCSIVCGVVDRLVEGRARFESEASRPRCLSGSCLLRRAGRGTRFGECRGVLLSLLTQ